ncbi:MAG TPA: single-stranded DNA-binding protein [Candidatus Saccharimonadales bacterium]|nr:single-stranded DNA-binding protein [Candidatus Saccharimonadales bacterium]
MSKSINQVILMGNLTRDPELRTTPSGQSVCSFGIAVNRSWQGSDGSQQDAVDYFDITAWGKLGELVNQYLSKGRRCLIQGRLSYRAWEQDGQKRNKVEVVANDVTFLDSAGGQGGDGGGNARSSSSSSNSSQSNAKKNDDVAIEDVDEKIDLSEIPF